MPWKHFSSIVTDHYYSCPKKLANIVIHQPTSAIRGTLAEPHEGKKRRFEATRDPSFPKPCPQSPSRHDWGRMEVDSSPFYDLRSASPEPSLPVAGQNTPGRSGSFTVAVRSQHMEIAKHAPNSPHRLPEAPRGPRDRPIHNSHHPPPRPIDRLPSPRSILHVIQNDKPPPPSLGVLPPVWNRKRKRAQFQEPALDAPSLRRHLQPSETPDVVEIQPRRPSPLLIERVPDRSTAVEFTTVERGTSSPSPLCTDGEDPRPTKKEKKNVMSWEQRRLNMMQDQLLLKVEPKRVFCKPCHKWIKLDARNVYYPGLWIKHRRTMHGAEDGATPFPASERRRRSRSDDEKTAANRKEKATGVSRNSQDQVQESYRRNAMTSTRLVRSYSRISCSSSGAST
ncbi:hypothetical protein P691DRAFT_773707 [Macrolepiota fuliginosa MF-IS2]|uniref:Uncharacterized protein n=1 Tax=Macrolepiota fuliginosa MF-IS2 TaxID=1400762 RepID=A0A9P5XJI3_9AGAR|nr:hypothetical protein P691DRAFT_773707 [Macrolepiota fuliginosa MF-IS2]